MFDVSFVELLVIGIIALLVVGPERLPGLARTVGLWVGKARAMVMDVKADIDKELREDELRRKLGLDSLGKDAKALEDLKKILESSVDKDERSDYLVKAIDAQQDAEAQREADARREAERRGVSSASSRSGESQESFDDGTQGPPRPTDADTPRNDADAAPGDGSTDERSK
ncbi:twin-arginine translocase subunit TatB [Ectothiorhodospiraceae bacterium 2226]|nr:twin-arginine translocase subunit TatB [Ectothiorhodospiraceae bacterium 2226]